ncbi:MAG: tetratricopeptide repeat protein [Bacteroidales bacterium]|jgi:tetratricopeptide (TPR) repeat protein|nr:tetratricopeptide repeat protein [Bacteroidales bacterium]
MKNIRVLMVLIAATMAMGTNYAQEGVHLLSEAQKAKCDRYVTNGMDACKSEKYEEAIKNYETALNECGEDFFTNNNIVQLGFSYSQTKNYDKAIEFFQKFFNRNPDSEEKIIAVSLALGASYLGQENFNKAYEIYTNLSEGYYTIGNGKVKLKTKISKDEMETIKFFKVTTDMIIKKQQEESSQSTPQEEKSIKW